MSLENMTEMSHLLFATAAVFAVLAIILFFSFDIPKCFRMVSGKPSAHSRKIRDINRETAEKGKKSGPRTEVLTGSEETFLLDTGSEETLALDGTCERTQALGRLLSDTQVKV